MSRTDHPRRPKLRGHVATVRHIRCYDGVDRFQSVCSCGLSGPMASFWHVANNDSRDHHAKVREQAERAS